MDFKIGDVVIAAAGRDEGRLFVITETVDDIYVKMVDGSTRPTERPKLKKTKHIKLRPASDGEQNIYVEIRRKIDESKLTNAYLRKTLKQITDDE